MAAPSAGPDRPKVEEAGPVTARAGRTHDEADLAWLLRQVELDYPLARQLCKQHLGFFAAKYLDRLARLAGRSDLPPDYEAESGDA